MPGTVKAIGAAVKTSASATFGCSTSFCINLIASASGCSSPNGPTRFGPSRDCMRPMTRRSTQTLTIATPPMKPTMPAAPSSPETTYCSHSGPPASSIRSRIAPLRFERSRMSHQCSVMIVSTAAIIGQPRRR